MTILSPEGMPVTSDQSDGIKHSAVDDRLITIYIRGEKDGKKFIDWRINKKLTPLDVIGILNMMAKEITPLAEQQARGEGNVKVVPGTALDQIDQVAQKRGKHVK